MIVLSAILILVQLSRTQLIVRAAALNYMDQTAAEAQHRVISELLEPTLPVVQALAGLPEIASTSTPSVGPESWTPVIRLLRQLPQLYGLYVGYDDGNFFQ